ncbi:diguanylate cyclase [Guyparkeria sp. 1SP6A2]|nr:diguanylate cyclase [Guyparkeria sp. 1SP6A2]
MFTDEASRRIRLRNIAALLLGISVFALLSWSHFNTFSKLKKTVGDEALSHLELEAKSLTEFQAQFARQVFEDNLDQPEILALMHQAANTEDAETRSKLRQELFERLDPLYARLKAKGVRQLHFHLPGAISFARFHRPERFGDDLWPVRMGLRLVNTTREPISGFEEGRVFNGFRHIFPLFYQGEFIGSVETSFSFRSFLLNHADLGQSIYRLLVRRALVVEKVWDAEQEENYAPSFLNPSFVLDRQADVLQIPELADKARSWTAGRLQKISTALAPRVQSSMQNWETFSITILHPSPIVASFIPVEATNGQPGAYLVRYAEAPELATAWSSLWLKVALSAVLVLLVIGTVAVLNRREISRAHEREKFVRSLRDREEILEEAQRLARVGNWALNIDSGRIEWSDEVYRIFGYQPDAFEPTYERFMEVVHPDDRAAIEREVGRTLENSEPYDIEHRILMPDGELRYVHERGMLSEGEEGEPRRLLGTVQDITERVLAGREMRQAAAILEATIEAVLIVDQDLQVLSANPAMERISRCPEADLIGRHLGDLIQRPGDDDSFESVIATLQQEGAWDGELWLYRNDEGGDSVPTRASLTSITTELNERRYVAMLSDISDSKSRERAMWHQAHHDPLTGLANRALFRERFERELSLARRHGDRVGLIYVDLDEFKPINDAHGHSVGDALLAEVAARMLAVTRETDIVARLGGDEFALLVARPQEIEDVQRVIDKLQTELSRPLEVQGLVLQPAASIGMAIFPEDGKTAEALMAAADTRMYEEKRSRQGRRTSEAPTN